MIGELARLRDIYLHLRAKSERNGGHPPLEPAWDNNKICY